MADVSRDDSADRRRAAAGGKAPPTRRRDPGRGGRIRIGDRDRGRDRGQLFLVTALALAVAFVGLALLFNTAIYTENLATRNADPGTADAVAYRASVESGLGGLVDAVNRHNDTSYPALSANLTAGVRGWSDTVAAHRAARATATNVSLDAQEVENGTRIGQANATRNFSNRTGATDWRLVEDTPALRAFRLNVSEESLVESDADVVDGSSAFRVTLTDDTGDSWTVYVYRDGDGSGVGVAVENDTDVLSAACTATPGPDGHVVVDVTGATVGGDDCAGLSFVGSMSGDVDVAFEEADEATGTYGLVVAEDFSTLDATGNYYDADASSESPFATEAVYAANATLTYENADVYYRTDLRIAPGEPS